jgi:hypothetical protein
VGRGWKVTEGTVIGSGRKSKPSNFGELIKEHKKRALMGFENFLKSKTLTLFCTNAQTRFHNVINPPSPSPSEQAFHNLSWSCNLQRHEKDNCCIFTKVMGCVRVSY